MPAIPQSVPTQPGSSTHQEREIESIPIPPCEHGPETGGLEAEPPGGRPGAAGWPCGDVPHQRTGKLQLPVSGAGVPGSFSPGKRRQQAAPGLCGWGRSHVGHGIQRSQPGRQAGRPGGLGQRSADLLRRWWPPPRPLTHLPGRWRTAGVVGSSHDFSPFGSRSQASDFRPASVVVKARRKSVPSSLGRCPLPSSASHRCARQPPWQPLGPPWARSAQPGVLPTQF